ncbi:MAG: UvrD-helicase domain-containing protein [Acidobacteria bacterium]|nr:UvrD-helicase domain-containing protein [Acidobacteriota bacterium]
MNQQKALDLNRNLAVTAGAGSGKTSVLVERFVQILRRYPGLEVSRILALTFTKKAAGEMRDRIRTRLLELVNDPGAETGRWQRALEELDQAHISTLHSFCASLLRAHPVEAGVDPSFETVEGMDERLLQEESLEDALALLEKDDHGPGKGAVALLYRHWKRSGLRSVLRELMSHRQRAAPQLAFYRCSPVEEVLRNWQERTQHRVLQIIEKIRRDAALGNAIRQLRSVPAANSRVLDHCQSLCSAWDRLVGLPDVAAGAFLELLNLCFKKDGKPVRVTAPEVEAQLKIVNSRLELFLEYRDLIQANFDSDREREGVEVLQALEVAFRAFLEAYRERKRNGQILDFTDLEEMADRLLGRSEEVGQAQKKLYRFVMVDEFQDTNDAQWRILRALVSDEQGRLERDRLFIVGDPKQSIYRFRNADVTVFNEVKPFLVEANRRHNCGDMPFLSLEGTLLPSHEEERMGMLTLDENFRSVEGPLDFCNFLFERILETTGEPWEAPFQRLRQMKREPAVAGSVELLLIHPLLGEAGNRERWFGRLTTRREWDEEEPEGEPAIDLEEAEQEAELAARRLRALRESGVRIRNPETDQPEPVSWGHMAMLLARRTQLQYFESALRKYRVPFHVASGVGFYQRQEIFDLANLVLFLVNPDDDVALVGALRSPLLGLSDETLLLASSGRGGSFWQKIRGLAREKPAGLPPSQRDVLSRALAWLEEWLALRGRLPVSELLGKILEDAGGWMAYRQEFARRGEQSVANLEKLLDQARRFQGSGFLSLADFAERLSLLMDEETREGEAQLQLEKSDTVKILTIHGAKGLEFPVVLVPEIHRHFNFGRSWVYSDKNYGLALCIQDPSQDFKVAPTHYARLLRQLHREQEIVEQRRLFYVAATRARDMLMLSGRIRFPKEKRADRLTWGAWVREAVGRKLVPASSQSSGFVPVYDDPGQIPIRPDEPAPKRLQLDEALQAASSWTDEPLPSQHALPVPEWNRRLAPLARAAAEFSASEVETFSVCPRKYLLAHALKMDERQNTGAASGTEISPVLLGTVLHRLFEIHPAGGTALPRESIRRLLQEYRILEGTRRDSLEERIAAIYDRFQRSSLGLEMSAAAGLFSEQPFLLILEEGRVRGKMDKLWKIGSGWRILDFKTGSLTPAELEKTAAHYETQMKIYALAVHKVVGGENKGVHASLYFTELDCAYDFDFGGRFQEIELEVNGWLRQMKEQQYPLVNRPEICYPCGYFQSRLCRPLLVKET